MADADEPAAGRSNLWQSGVRSMDSKWMPIVLEEQCIGCGLCVDACGPKSLAMADGIAVLAFPDTCGSRSIASPPALLMLSRWHGCHFWETEASVSGGRGLSSHPAVTPMTRNWTIRSLFDQGFDDWR